MGDGVLGGGGEPSKNPYMKGSREKHGYSRNKQKKSHASFNQHVPDSVKVALGPWAINPFSFTIFIWSFP